MTDAQKHAARLRGIAATNVGEHNRAALLAGAEALEAQGRWRIVASGGAGPRHYFIPAERLNDFLFWDLNREAGEPSAIVPDWATPVPENVIIAGWEK